MIKQKQQDGNRGRSDSSSVNEGLHSSVLSLQTFTPGKRRECLQGSGNAKGYNSQAPPRDLEETTPARETETLQHAGCKMDRVLQRSSPQESSGWDGFFEMCPSACELPMPCEEYQQAHRLPKLQLGRIAPWGSVNVRSLKIVPVKSKCVSSKDCQQHTI